jgi:hypothetical protein
LKLFRKEYKVSKKQKKRIKKATKNYFELYIELFQEEPFQVVLKKERPYPIPSVQDSYPRPPGFRPLVLDPA